MGEYSQCSAKQYEQDQEKQQQASAHTANNNAQPSSESVPRSFNSNRVTASNLNPVPNLGQDPNPGPDSSPHSSPPPPPPPSDPNSEPDSDPDPDPNPNPIPQPPCCVPPGGRPFVEPVELHSLGPMNIQCPMLQFSFFIHIFSYYPPSLFTVLGALLELSPLTSSLLLVHILFFYDPSKPRNDITTNVMFANIL